MIAWLQKHWIEVAIVVSAVGVYLLASRSDAFEYIYQFSRTYEAWELDEFILVYAIIGVFLPIILIRANRKLKDAVRQMAKAEAETRYMAQHDALTGLYARGHFYNLLQSALQDAHHDAVPVLIIFDLDRFKPINDLRGHVFGDRVLQVVATRVASLCEGRGEACRLGGDEFAVLVGDAAAAQTLAEDVQQRIADPIKIDHVYVSLTVSIGLSSAPASADAMSWLRSADQAMYKAKHAGQGKLVVFDEALGESQRQQAVLEVKLRSAIDRDQIEPMFQPIFDVVTREIRGFEVLARWHSPSLGLVAPEAFIPLAEQMGLIGPLTWQLMGKALPLISLDSSIFLAFNVSPQLFAEDLLPNIQTQLSATSTPAHRVEIEMTESAVAENIVQARAAIEDLKAIGMRVAIDDFGTGFSSLSALSQLPFDKLKIDKSFVSGVDRRTQNAKIIAATLALARSMDLMVTAEGIETEQELDFLARRACTLGQGFLVSGPVTAEAVPTLLRTQAQRPQIVALR